MLCGKMFVPLAAFYANPFTAIAAGIVGKILTTNQAEVAIITKPCTLRAVLLTVGADVRAFLAGTAILANQNTI
jgi:hypothetical protein